MTVEKLLRNSDLKLHLKGLSDPGEPISVRSLPKKVLALESIGLSFPALLLLLAFRSAQESSRKAAILVNSLVHRFLPLVWNDVLSILKCL